MGPFSGHSCLLHLQWSLITKVSETLAGIVCQDETEEIADEHDLDNDADDLDDDDVTEDVPEHFADELDIETKEKEINQVTF